MPFTGTVFVGVDEESCNAASTARSLTWRILLVPIVDDFRRPKGVNA